MCSSLSFAELPIPSGQPTAVSAASIRFKQLKQSGWENWPAIKELIELGEAEVLQTAITQLRLSDGEWVADAVEALSLVSQPRLIGLLINDVMSGSQGTAEPDEDEEVDVENQPAPGPASQVIIAQLSKIPSVQPETKTWLVALSQLPNETRISQMRTFLEANRGYIAESKLDLLKAPTPEAE